MTNHSRSSTQSVNHSNVIKNNENVDIKYGSHDTFQESPVRKVIIVMFKYCNAVLVKIS